MCLPSWLPLFQPALKQKYFPEQMSRSESGCFLLRSGSGRRQLLRPCRRRLLLPDRCHLMLRSADHLRPLLFRRQPSSVLRSHPEDLMQMHRSHPVLHFHLRIQPSLSACAIRSSRSSLLGFSIILAIASSRFIQAVFTSSCIAFPSL